MELTELEARALVYVIRRDVGTFMYGSGWGKSQVHRLQALESLVEKGLAARCGCGSVNGSFYETPKAIKQVMGDKHG